MPQRNRRSIEAERKFRERVTELGGEVVASEWLGANIKHLIRCANGHLGATVLEPAWLGSQTPHRVRCAKGHDCTPRPAHSVKGAGICLQCAGKVRDAFYVVANDDLNRLKLGVTSGDSRPRLRDHARHGYRRVLRRLEGMSGKDAPQLERQCLTALSDAGVRAVQGKEYFDTSCLALVLDIVDHSPHFQRTAS